MNFIEAHKLVHEYCAALSKPVDKHALIFRPASSCGFPFDKDRIIQAFKLFYAHMILFDTRTQIQFEQYEACLLFLNYFIDDNTYEDIIKCVVQATDDGHRSASDSGIITARNNTVKYLRQITEIGVSKYKCEELEGYFAVMQSYFTFLCKNYSEKFDTVELFVQIVNAYCKTAYQEAGESFSDDDLIYFHDFDVLRKMVDMKEYQAYFIDYRDYILQSR